MRSKKNKIKKGELELPAKDNFLIVGIGASAGGLAALETFFSGMPKDKEPGLAFVIVQHLAPDHKSILTELIKRYTPMDVFEVQDGMHVNPNCTYIIPPGKDMALLNGKLQLFEPIAPRGQRLPIDFFFHSLADDQHNRAICIVLSGTGSDGTLGSRAIKREGGMVIAQTPESSDYDGMPRSAINSGFVDYILHPMEMPDHLIHYASHFIGKAKSTNLVLTENVENLLNKIFVLLRTHTGHDFSGYKPGTIQRRIERRMFLQQIDSLSNYIKLLTQNPSEVEGLYRDLLIGVTNFFRDPDVFKTLEEKIIPNLFENKPEGSTIRIWVPGCATGEEAYSIAILLHEYLDKNFNKYKVVIFATDLDDFAIAEARLGIFSATIKASISEERFTRFFSIDPDDNLRYRIKKNIREMIIFSIQDIIKDPPFSQLDLISCRNLLIYFGADLQKGLIPLFHYALKEGGILLLGTSETIGEFTDLFSIIDRKDKFYQRKRKDYAKGNLVVGKYIPTAFTNIGIQFAVKEKTKGVKKISFKELAEQTLLQQVTPPSILINAEGDILFIHGRTGMYLEPASGDSITNNILKMAREGLKHELFNALHKAVISNEKVIHPEIRVKTNGHYTYVDLTIFPTLLGRTPNSDTQYYLVILEEVKKNKEEKLLLVEDNSELSELRRQISDLKQELLTKDIYIQSANGELETTNEELKSSNEEMQSINEELQSTNEELETSKEEMQSVNEELSTVNSELQSKLTDVFRANNDMNNLLSGTGIATIFVDLKLQILRFTPTAKQIINLMVVDIGRPIGHILSNLINYDNLVLDIEDVLDTLIPKEIEVKTKENRWYSLRILPYRTIENVIEGAVLSFVDINEIKLIEETLRNEKAKFRFQSSLLQSVGEAVIATELNGEIVYWNKAAENLYGWKTEEVIGKNIIDITPTETNRQQAQEILEAIQTAGFWSGEFNVKHRDGHQFIASVTDTAILDEFEKISIIVGVSKNITDRKDDERKIKRLLEEKETILKEVHHRLKNNMNTIYSILNIQAQRIGDSSAGTILEDAANRIRNMMVLYDKLYQSVNFQEVEVSEYLPALVDEIIEIFPIRKDLEVNTYIEKFVLSTSRIQPLSIIINEILTNIMKHAFKKSEGGKIEVSANIEGELVVITIQDNGIGIPETISIENSTGFGFILIKLLVGQLSGSIRIERENGTKFIITFEK